MVRVQAAVVAHPLAPVLIAAEAVVVEVAVVAEQLVRQEVRVVVQEPADKEKVAVWSPFFF